MSATSPDRSVWSTTPHDRFLDQFDWDGAGYLYRFNRTGPLYRLTEDQRDAVVAAFDRRQRRILWTICAIYVAWVFILIKLPTFRDMPKDSWSLLTNGTNLVALFGIRPLVDRLPAYWTPTHTLDHLTPVAPAMSESERRRFALDRISDHDLIRVAVIAAGLLCILVAIGWPTDNVAIFLIAVAAVMLLWVAVQGMRKWRLARADYLASNLT